MNCKEIIINTNTEGSELVADAFFSIGCNGVKIIDKNDILDIIKDHKLWDYVDEELLKNEEDTVKVSGFVSEDELTDKLDQLHSIINNYPFINGIVVVNNNVDWYNNWKNFYKPIEAGKFVVIPKWLKYDNKDNKTEIFIDPGMAFGTGEHQSTRLCLMLMSLIDIQNKNVIDVGTGSGILGIGAIKRGAKSCYMCDIDSIAIKAAKENAQLNNIICNESVIIESADLLEKEPQKAEIILANLTADILIRLSWGLKEHIAKGGYMICSGIINSRYDEVVSAYSEIGFTLEKKMQMDDWSAILFRS